MGPDYGLEPWSRHIPSIYPINPYKPNERPIVRTQATQMFEKVASGRMSRKRKGNIPLPSFSTSFAKSLAQDFRAWGSGSKFWDLELGVLGLRLKRK